MKSKYFVILLIILVLLIPIQIFGIINTMVSLKYETENPSDCISRITGNDLCNSIKNMKISIGIDVLIIILLLVFKKKIIKNVA